MRTINLLLLAAGWLLASISLPAQSFHSPGGTIPNNSTGNCFNLDVAGVGSLSPTDGLVRVCLSIDQARPNDLDISLCSPSGTVISLSTDNGGSSGNDYYQGICFSECGPSGPISSGSNFRGVYTPKNSLAAFNTGVSGDGTWSLCIDDDNALGSDGRLNYWSLEFGTSTMPTSPNGDDCANALPLTSLPFSHTCMTLATSNNDYNSCTGMMGGADYIFAYTPASSGEHLSVDIAQDYFAPSGFPTVVLLDTCPDLAFPANCIQTEIQMSSTENILHITSQPLTQGKTYYVVAASTSGTGGIYDIRIDAGQNGNDDCLNATEITDDSEYAGNNYTATIPSVQSPGTAEMTCNGSIDNFVFYTFTTDAIGSTVHVNITDIDCDVSCGGSCGIQLALFEEPAGGPCLGPGSWGAPIHCEASTQTNAYYAWSGLTPNTRYYLMVDGNAGSTCVWNLRAMGDFQQTILPVDFLSVDVQTVGEMNTVLWQTESEVNTDYFEVEYSTELPYFEAIGREAARPQAEGRQAYRLVHSTAEPGWHYYRVRSVDLDGQITLSDIAKVYIDSPARPFQISPNPAHARVTIVWDSDQSADLALFDGTGQMIGSAQRTNGGHGRIEWDLSGLAPGFYVVRARMENGTQFSERLVKR